MPPPVHLIQRKPRALPRRLVGWNQLRARFVKEMNSFATPLNDLGFDDRTLRVKALMARAYRMGRSDQARLEKLRK